MECQKKTFWLRTWLWWISRIVHENVAICLTASHAVCSHMVFWSLQRRTDYNSQCIYKFGYALFFQNSNWVSEALVTFMYWASVGESDAVLKPTYNEQLYRWKYIAIEFTLLYVYADNVNSGFVLNW